MLIGKCKQFSHGEQLFWYLLIALRLGKEKAALSSTFQSVNSSDLMTLGDGKVSTTFTFQNLSRFIISSGYVRQYILIPGETNAAHAKVLQSLGTNLIKHTWPN